MLKQITTLFSLSKKTPARKSAAGNPFVKPLFFTQRLTENTLGLTRKHSAPFRCGISKKARRNRWKPDTSCAIISSVKRFVKEREQKNEFCKELTDIKKNAKYDAGRTGGENEDQQTDRFQVRTRSHPA